VNLSLWKNKLKSLPERAFFGLSALVNLDLSLNQIKTIENGAFDGLVNLQSLNLSGNPFVSLDMSVLNKSDLAMLNKLRVHGFSLRSTSVNSENVNSAHDNSNQVVLITHGCGSLIDALTKKGLLHLTYNTLTEIS
jgi:Leucine-rich repeat (LRR) protein